MKKSVTILLLIVMRLPLLACPVCDQRQLKVLKGITHGAGPENNWDYVIIITAMTIVVFTLFFSVKWLVKPGESAADHIKRFILTNR
ncbi:hypothetical protein [Dyadobacter pollutisoli]|uniref:Uncharacterized protein n=1 Tax=Dyadobacter pollutisoli TaxID=2910158 RepID=A0A9E8N9I9_9BACT|nr:hypothetical protein [Dyadobacter pollutisoli]WAC12460.1 hypothetical protein ON006_00570 [Dyadobacter pollutisoli]